MPRIIPRLLHRLELARTRPPSSRLSRPDVQKPGLSLSPQPYNHERPDDVDIRLNSRSRSILLDRAAVRQVYRHARYQRKKADPPKIRISKHKSADALGRAIAREMTPEERSFYANPYCKPMKHSVIPHRSSSSSKDAG